MGDEFILKNIDLNWFLSTPGILTGLGCLLIVISIIIFVSSFIGKKGKKSEETVGTSSPTPASINNDAPVSVTAQPVETPVAEAQTSAPEVVTSQPVVQPASETIEGLGSLGEVGNSSVSVQPVETPVEIPTVSQPEVPATKIEETVTVNEVPVENNTNNDNVATPEVQNVPQPEIASSPSISATDNKLESKDVPSVPTSDTVVFSGININPTITPIETQTPEVKEPVAVEPQPTNKEVASTPELPIQSEPAKEVDTGIDPLAGTGIIPAVEPSASAPKEDIESL